MPHPIYNTKGQKENKINLRIVKTCSNCMYSKYKVDSNFGNHLKCKKHKHLIPLWEISFSTICDNYKEKK